MWFRTLHEDQVSECKQCEKQYGSGECVGPCYDLCACRHCWRGWTGFKFRHRLRWRLTQMWWDWRNARNRKALA